MDPLLDHATPEELAALAAIQQRLENIDKYNWLLHARPEQLPPADTLIWFLLGGRGSGKTRTGGETVKAISGYGDLPNIIAQPGSRGAIIAPTFGDARDTCIEGDGGLLEVLPPQAIKHWNRSMGELVLANGTFIKLFSADQPERIRGKNLAWAWIDEPGSMPYGLEAWDMLRFALRRGKQTFTIVTGTPRARSLVLHLLGKKVKGIEGRSDVTVTHMSTFDNAANLSPTALEEYRQRYEGTRLGRQELYAELLTDTPGAMWTLDGLDQTRVKEAPEMAKICVAIDPSGGHAEANDEQGIFAIGRGVNGDIYGLKDSSCKLSPDGWGRRAIQLYLDLKANIMIAEKNYGGEMVQHTIETVAKDMGVHVNFSLRNASRGKDVRAEPISALWEQRKGHLVGSFPELEEELTTWTKESGWSPNRLDAFVWGATELIQRPPGTYEVPSGSIF